MQKNIRNKRNFNFSMMELEDHEKKIVINEALVAAGKILTHAYKACGLSEKIEGMLVNEENGEEFVLTFYPSKEFSERRVKEYELSNSITEKMTHFVNSQQGIPNDIAKVINEKFWDLL